MIILVCAGDMLPDHLNKIWMKKGDFGGDRHIPCVWSGKGPYVTFERVTIFSVCEEEQKIIIVQEHPARLYLYVIACTHKDEQILKSLSELLHDSQKMIWKICAVHVENKGTSCS